MADPTISHYYAADHDRLDELFGRFQSSKQSDRTVARHLFAEFKAGLERHIAWEEDLLFPLFEAHTGMHAAGPTAVMRDEHRQINTSWRSSTASCSRRMARPTKTKPDCWRSWPLTTRRKSTFFTRRLISSSR